MKVIDLLNKIANGEEVPKKIKYNEEIWEYDKNLENYTRAGKPSTLFTLYYIHKILNDEIEIIEKPILTDKEREYLKAVIKPFKVTSIEKCEWNDEVEYISIEVNGEWVIEFPTFKKGTRYKGMELNSYYTVEELDLEED